MNKPLIGIDMDGVICRPPLGLNVPIAPGPYETRPRVSKRKETPSGARLMAMKLLLKLKYYGRKPLEDARDGIASIREFRTPVLVTSRNGLGTGLIEQWLKVHGFLELFREVHSNSLGLPSPDFKWHMCSELGIEEFVDDDGRVADLLSRNGLKRIYLRDWPRNRGYNYGENVTRVTGLMEVARRLAADAQARSG